MRANVEGPESQFFETPVQGELFAFAPESENIRGYRGSVAMKIAGITYRQLDYWARKRIIEPSVNPSHGSGSRRLYSTKDIAIMAVAKRLLDAGMNLQNVTTAIMFLDRHSFARLSDMTILCNGCCVKECDANQRNMQQMLADGDAVVVLSLSNIMSKVESSLESEEFSTCIEDD